MARIRTIKPEFWTHEELSALPEATHILAGALLNYADDHGYFNANTGLVKAACSPLREPSVSIPESFRSLQVMGYVRLGTAPDGKRYGQIVHFDQHQRVSHPSASKIADLTITWDDSGNIPENLVNPPETFRPEQGTGNREQGTGNGTSSLRSDMPISSEPKAVASKPRKPPSTPMPADWDVPPDWILEANEKRPGFDWRTEAARFVSHHRAKGSTFSDWKAAWWTWVNSPYAKTMSNGSAGLFAAQVERPRTARRLGSDQ